MQEEFDPYHKWLGIPPEEQPANHYRLLAINLFEADLDVIESAADQRMAHLRTYQAGKYSALSQKLLNEVAMAKVCLLNAQKKLPYDEQLRQSVQSPAEAVTPPPGPSPESPPMSPPMSPPAAPAYNLDNLGLNPPPVSSGSGIGSRTATMRRPTVAIKQAARMRRANAIALRVWVMLIAVAVAVIAGLLFVRNSEKLVENDSDSVSPPVVHPATPPSQPSLPALGSAYRPDGPLSCLDLKNAANLWAGMPLPPSVKGGNGGKDVDVINLPRGEQTYCGVKFQLLGGVLQLGGGASPIFPSKISSIRVNQRFSKLYILQGTRLAGAGLVADGTPIGEYRVHYGDKSQAVIPIIYGADVRRWDSAEDSAPSTAGGRVAWAGRRVAAKSGDGVLRLYSTCWTNPRPDALVKSIDFRSLNPATLPFCVAMTLELPKGSMPGKSGLGRIPGKLKSAPSLTAPEAGAVLPNHEPESTSATTWEFQWLPVDEATKYQLSVQAPNHTEPVIDAAELTTPSYSHELREAVPDEEKTSWRWRVRAFVKGQWTGWSEERTFDVGSPSGDSAASSGAPAEVATVKAPAKLEVPAEPERHKAPDAAARAKAEKQAESRFADELSLSKTWQTKQVLAKKILQQVDETKEDSDRWGLLEVARKLATSIGDAETAIQAIEYKAAMFDVEPATQLKEQIEALDQAYKLKVLPEQKKLNAAAAMRIIDRLASADDYEAAVKSATESRDVAKEAGDLIAAKHFDNRVKELETRQAEYVDVQRAGVMLKSQPDNPEANHVLGRYLCVAKDNWKKGLPLLAKGSDEALKDLARQEAADPTEPASQVQLADGWYAAAKKDLQRPIRPFFERAKHWYEQSVGSLSGSELKRVEKRIEELKARFEPKRSKPKGAAAEKAESTIVGETPESRPGTIFSSGATSYEMYINGVRVAGGVGGVDVTDYEFKEGDVITVRGRESGAFPCVAVFPASFRSIRQRTLRREKGHPWLSPRRPAPVGNHMSPRTPARGTPSRTSARRRPLWPSVAPVNAR